MENNKCKILWDFTVQTDHEIYGRRPDIILVQKDKNLCQIIDFACPNWITKNQGKQNITKVWHES